MATSGAPLRSKTAAGNVVSHERFPRTPICPRATQEASHDGRRRHQERDRRQGALLVTIGIPVLAAIVAGLLLVST
jgi:hypothetical protein